MRRWATAPNINISSLLGRVTNDEKGTLVETQDLDLLKTQDAQRSGVGSHGVTSLSPPIGLCPHGHEDMWQRRNRLQSLPKAGNRTPRRALILSPAQPCCMEDPALAQDPAVQFCLSLL